MGEGLFKREWLQEDVHPQVFAYYFKQWNNYSMNFHTHDSIEIMYAITGECRIELQSKRTAAAASHELKKGGFIILDGNVPHRLLVDERGPCRMLNVEFSMGAMRTTLPSLRQLAQEDGGVAALAAEASDYLVLQDSEQLYPLLKSLVLDLDSRDKSRRTRIGLMFSQLLVTVGAIRSRTVNEGEQPAEQYVRGAVQYMHHNYDRPIQVKDIAAAVNVHPGYLHRLFSAAIGKPISAYLTELRMEKAKMLLRQTDIPIADICDYVGVGSRQYFHAMFKRYSGATPIAFRQSVQAEQWDRGQAIFTPSDDF